MKILRSPTPGQLALGRRGTGQRCSGPWVRPSHLQSCSRHLSLPPRSVVSTLPASTALAHVEVVGKVDSGIKGISQAQGVSLEQRVNSFNTAPLSQIFTMDAFQSFLPFKPPPAVQLSPSSSPSLQSTIPSYTGGSFS